MRNTSNPGKSSSIGLVGSGSRRGKRGGRGSVELSDNDDDEDEFSDPYNYNKKEKSNRNL